MRTLAGDKVREIIRDNFDERIAMTVVTYIIDKGWDCVSEITEEEILEIKGNAFMTDTFTQALVRTAVKICKECNMIDEFLPFVINFLHVPNAATKSIEIYKDDVSEYNWERLLDKFNLDYEEEPEKIEMLELNANLLGFYPEQQEVNMFKTIDEVLEAGKHDFFEIYLDNKGTKWIAFSGYIYTEGEPGTDENGEFDDTLIYRVVEYSSGMNFPLEKYLAMTEEDRSYAYDVRGNDYIGDYNEEDALKAANNWFGVGVEFQKSPELTMDIPVGRYY